MIRDKLTKFITYTGAARNIKRSLLGAAGLALSYSFVNNPLAHTKKYDQQYDLAVIGGGSGGLATAF